MKRSRWLAFFCGMAPTALVLIVYVMLGRSSSVEVPEPKPPASPQRTIASGSSLLHQWDTHSERSLKDSITFLEALDVDQVEALLLAAAPLKDSDSERFQMLFDRFAELETSTALDFAARTWSLERRLQRIATLVYRWADEDPDSCWAWISANYQASQAALWDPFLRQVYAQRSLGEPSLKELARTWSTLERVARSPDGFLGERIKSGVVEDPQTRKPCGSLWFLVNACKRTGKWQATMERLAEVSDDQLGSGWADLVFTYWKASDLDAAMSWHHHRIDVGLSRCRGESGYARVEADRGADLAWLIENERIDRIYEVKDIPRMTSWLTTVDAEDPRYDEIRMGLAERLEGIDMHGAVSWARSIAATGIRDQVVKQTIRHWAELEPSAAEDYTRDELGWSAEDFVKAIEPVR